MTLFLRRFSRLAPRSWRGVALLLVLAWLLHNLLGLLPWNGSQPLVVHLMPAAGVVFAGVYLLRAGEGMLLVMAASLLALVLGGGNLASLAGLQALALAPFGLMVALAVQRWPALRWIAPVAWGLSLGAVAVAGKFLGFAPTEGSLKEVLGAAGLVTLPGLALLAALNHTLVILLPKDADWDAR